MSIDRAIEVLATKESILVFTGAGISTESGIPDFRGPDGVWTRVDPADFTIDRYLTNREVRIRSWEMRTHSGVLDAEPNDGHRAIASLWQTGRLRGVVTQNIDGLHVASGIPADSVIELHGNARTTSCVECGAEYPTTEVAERVRTGTPDPRCSECDGVLKVDVVFFGEAMPAAAMTRAMAWASGCDAVLAVGSTLSVYPAASIPVVAAEAGSPLVIVNQGATDLDQMAAVCVDAGASHTLSALAAALA